MKDKKISEETLITEALKGSPAHLNQLITAYEQFILETVERQVKCLQDSLDIRQRVCCKIVKHFTQQSYVHQNKFLQWTSSIIRSEVNNHYREKQQRKTRYFTSEMIEKYADIEDVAAEEDLLMIPNLIQLINQLPTEQAVVIKLKCFQNKTFREIAQLLSEPINTIMGRYRYGLERIRGKVKKNDFMEEEY